MKCICCGGEGDWGRYGPEHGEPEDPGVTACDECDGTGRMSLAVWSWWQARMWWNGVAERIEFSFLGCWWWRLTRHWRAKRLSRSREMLGLMAKHGERWDMLQRQTAMTETLGGAGLDQIIARQRRLVWEAARAVELKQESTNEG